MLEALGKLASLGLAVAIPFLGCLAKHQLIKAEERDFSRRKCGRARRKGKQWKSHDATQGAWPIMYTLLGLASWLVWREGGLRANSAAFGRYFCLIAANLLCWPPIFFGGHSRSFAVLDSAVLLMATVLTVPKFYEAHHLAGLILLPYLGWICFSTTLINSSFLSCNSEVCSKVRKITAFETLDLGTEAKATTFSPPSTTDTKSMKPSTTDKRQIEVDRGPDSCGQKPSISVLTSQTATADAATSPFQTSTQSLKSPLAQAKDLLSKMTESLSSNDRCEATSNEYIKAGILRVNSLLSKVSGSIQGAAEVFGDGQGSALSRMGSRLLSRVSLSLSRGLSQDVESSRWPCSDSIPQIFFNCPGVAGYKVRGPNYLEDKRKIVPDDCVGQLVSLNLVSLKQPTYHIARFLPSIRDSKAPFIFVWQVMVPGRTHISLTVAWALDHDPEVAVKEAANRIPEDEEVRYEEEAEQEPSISGQNTPPQQTRAGGGGLKTPVTVRKRAATDSELLVEASSQSLTAIESRRAAAFHKHRRTASTVSASTVSASEAAEMGVGPSPMGSTASLQDLAANSKVPAPVGVSAFDVTMARFLDESGSEKELHARRQNTFKIIPRIEKGGWVVKQAVGQNTPVLLGKKLTTKYFRGPKYFEVDVDVGSSRSAASVVGLVQGALKSLVIDIAVLLEGHKKEELPEAVLGTVRLEHLDLSKAAVLDVTSGLITQKDD